jgi:3',5'-cyclic AMP phosphodiesterase CpdA
LSELTIVHLSDLHFAADQYLLFPEDALVKVSEVIAKRATRDDLVIVITGDITTQGRRHGYHEAARAIRRTLLEVVSSKDIFFCPGNHDIEKSAPRDFSGISRFVFEVTQNSTMVWSRGKTVSRVDRGEYSFILVNTAFHGDHRFGTVPVADLKESLKDAQPHPMVLIHHSPISSVYGGAALSNSYEFLSATSHANVCGILHGHIHSEQVLLVGKRPTFLAGAGSLSFEPEPNMNNHFVVHAVQDGRLTASTAYRYTGDRQEFFPVELVIR